MKRLLTLLLVLIASLALAQDPGFKIDAAFPGGNIRVGKIEGDRVELGPDQRENILPWFYWYFRVTGAAGRTLAFAMPKNSVGVRGPGVSTDGGATWKWLGAEAVADGTFSYAFPAEAKDVRFSVGMPYGRADFERWLARYQGSPFVHTEVLTKSRKGREVPLVRIGDPQKKARYTIAATARHHCCEMMASYVGAGLLEGALADDDTGRWLRENVEFLFVPFMDLDGVEEGDQGKNRPPYDHNRDYAKAPLYPEVAALKEYLPRWSAGRPLVFLDLHNPALRSDIHETVHFLAPEEPEQAARMEKLCAYLERDQQGPILYRKAMNLKFGSGYNTISAKPAPNSSGWARALPNTMLGCTIETAYANAGGCEVNTHSATELGRDLAAALAAFLRDGPERPGAAE